MKNGFGLGRIGRLGGCMSMHGLNSGRVEAQGFCGSRPSHVRTGLRAASCQPPKCNHMSCVGRTWLINLQIFIAVDPVDAVGSHITTFVVPPGARGGPEPADGQSKGGETLARLDCGGVMHCKSLVMYSRPLTKGSGGDIGQCRTNQRKHVLWVKLYTSAECQTIRIAVSTVMDMLAKPLKVSSWFWFSKEL